MFDPYATTALDLGTALRFSRMVTPRRDPLLDYVDQAIGACRVERNIAPTDERRANCISALEKLFEARALITGERQ